MVDLVTWQDDVGAWNEASAVFSKAKPVEIIGNNFHVLDEVDPLAAPHTMAVSISREGLTIYGRDQEGNPKTSLEVIKSVQGIWPEIEAPVGTTIMISVGAQMRPTDAVQWAPARPFIVGETEWLDFIVTGRYISVRFESVGQPVWVLSRYDLDIELSGGR